jgi:MFS superfamily sulfate permease-like transporter
MNFFKGCLNSLFFVIPFWCLVAVIILYLIVGR